MSATETSRPATPTAGLPLRIRGLSAGYGGPPVLRDIDLDVATGEVVALLGSNGAGKSTLARAITGFAVVTEGVIRLGDDDLVGTEPHLITRSGVAHVPQGRRLFPSLSVEQNLWLPDQWQRNDPAEYEQRLADVFERFPRLDDRRKQRAGSLSGGEQQMLTMARALFLRPRLLLLDEPSTGLAPLLVAEIFAIIRDLRSDLGVTSLLIEQNVAQALTVADRGVVLQRGQVVAEGPSGQLAQDADIRSLYLGG